MKLSDKHRVQLYHHRYGSIYGWALRPDNFTDPRWRVLRAGKATMHPLRGRWWIERRDWHTDLSKGLKEWERAYPDETFALLSEALLFLQAEHDFQRTFGKP